MAGCLGAIVSGEAGYNKCIWKANISNVYLNESYGLMAVPSWKLPIWKLSGSAGGQ